MSRVPALRSSTDNCTSRPEILPSPSKTLNALNMSTLHFGFHLDTGLAGFIHRPFVLDGSDVAGIPIEDHGLEHAAHQFAAARFRKHAHEVELADHGHRPELAPDGVDDRRAQFRGRGMPVL